MTEAGGGDRLPPWIAGLEKTLGYGKAPVEDPPWQKMLEKVKESLEETSRWQGHSIYRVPAWMKGNRSSMYQPRVVSLGPFHHGHPDLVPMEEHKRRALRHLVRRSGRKIAHFIAAVDDVAGVTSSTYVDLGAEWYLDQGGSRERFLEMMILDGCFLLEVMRSAAGERKIVDDYEPEDPIFSARGNLYTVPRIRRDMLMLENQLPLVVLGALLDVETAKAPRDAGYINNMVLSFLSGSSRTSKQAGMGFELHPLYVFQQNMFVIPEQRSPVPVPDSDCEGVARSALEFYEAGIRFKKSTTTSLTDIHFQDGVLTMPTLSVDANTESMFLNVMAFEWLHASAGNHVTDYVYFMTKILSSGRDVALLKSMGLVKNAIGAEDDAIAALLNRIGTDVALDPGSAPDAVLRQMNHYCLNNIRTKLNTWRFNLVSTYFRSPWTALSVAAATALFILTFMQTVYTALSFYHM